MIIVLIVVAVVCVALIALMWRYFLGVPNTSLPRAQVTVTSSSRDSVTGSSATTTTTSATATATAFTNSTSTSIPNPILPEEDLSINNATWTVELATTMVEQARGLSYRSNLAPHAGMLFIFPRASVQNFWMKDMHFPLDIIWIGSDGRVVGFLQDVPAPTPGTAVWNLSVYTSPRGVKEVLEVNAGTVAQYGIKVGDMVTMQPLP